MLCIKVVHFLLPIILFFELAPIILNVGTSRPGNESKPVGLNSLIELRLYGPH